MEADYYGILGIPPTAGSAEIQDAFHSFKSKNARFNTGLILSDESMKLQFPHVWNAYYTLSDPQRRLAYDSQFKIISIEDSTEQSTEVNETENSVTTKDIVIQNDMLIYKYIDKFNEYIVSLYFSLPRPLRKFLEYVLIILTLLVIAIFIYYLSDTPFQLI